MLLTTEQDRAINHHAENLIVVAGAGSGKTFVLVGRYLALLERNLDWALNALVAITFTQKAAQEMRDRVRQHLQRQVDEADEADTPRWAARLAAMDSARIDTIHGLCATILRANAAEAGVDPGFAVLDESEANVLLDSALDDVFRTLETGDPVLELFAEYGEKPLRAELRRLVRSDFETLAHAAPADFFTDWLEQWVTDAHALIARFQRGIGEVEHFAPVADDVLSLGWQVCRAVIDWFGAQTERRSLSDYLDRIEQIEALSLPGKVAGVWGEDGAAAKACFKFLRDQAKKTLTAIGAPPGAAEVRAARLLPLWMELVARVRAAYRVAKDERAALDFDDLETLTRALLQDDDVRARYLGAEFRHVLVDEFQDTNAAQWAIIRRIADPAAPGCLFVVGDPKQSIYGFRGADVSVFEQVRGVIGRSIPLDTSFRTHHRLIECLNGLFASVLVRDADSAVSAYQVEFGDGMRAQRLDAPCDEPVLELLLLDKERLKQAEADEEQAARRWEARAIARRIRQMVEDERRLIFDKQAQVTRPMGYGDVALLFQAMTHVTLYEAALKAEGIPYLTTAGKGYYDRQEVWDLLNLLRALYNPADNLALATALRSPLFSLSDDALLALRLIPGGDGKPLPLWDALDQPERVPADESALVAFARDTLRELRRKAGRVTIAELLRMALEATGYLAVLTGLPDGKRRRGNVEKLLEKADTSGRITLSAFTQYLKDMSQNESREGEALLESEGAVQLMTVHKSKGLEFPVVALVDASYQRRAGGGDLVSGLGCKVYDGAQDKLVSTFAHRRAEALADQRETAERRRLLYVAATRAQDHLLISGQVTCKEGKAIAAAGWLGWLLDALDLREIAPQETQVVGRGWGAARVDFPQPMRDADDFDEGALLWDELPAMGEPPALLADVPRAADAPARSLTATQVADLGSAQHANRSERRAYFAERWRQSVFHDAPSQIASLRPNTSVKLGEIVHRAIRWVLPQDDGELRDLLRRYAWEEGIVDEADTRSAVESAHTLLGWIRRSDVFAAVEQARAVYREVPFVYQRGQRTIHGVIDLLFESAAGQWRVVDYKTTWLGDAVTGAMLAEDARRYHVQMGIYAAAVQELVGVAPIVQIHYIRYVQSVTIDERDWKRALSQLEAYIGDVMGHG